MKTTSAKGAVMKQVRKTVRRRILCRERAEKLLESLRTGTGNAYERYRALYALWCSNNGALEELRPLFRIPGIYPDGPLSVTEEFNERVRVVAQQIPPLDPNSKVSSR
jgi:hypothetical protein